MRVALGTSWVAGGILPKIGCWKWWMGLEKPRRCFSDTPLFALVKLELSVFCKNYTLACHRSIFIRPYWRKQILLRIKNLPRKPSQRFLIGLMELSRTQALHTNVSGLAILKKRNLVFNQKLPQKTILTLQIGLLELPGEAKRVLHIRG